jgi:hypothetical protein
MKKFFAILCAVTMLATAGFAYANDNENECGEYGDNCCTRDRGRHHDSVEATCFAFCTSTAVAVSVAVSECEAKASATCSQECGSAVATATASCAQTCTVPLCLKWRIRYDGNGRAVARTCKKTTEQPIVQE